MTKTTKPKVFLCYPSYDAKPAMKSMHSLFQSINYSKCEVKLYYSMYESLVSRMRNIAFANFLKSDSEWFVTLDADIEVMNPPAAYNWIDKLVDNAVDFCGGVYALKKFPIQPASIFADKADVPFHSGLKKMKFLSAGNWCIRRSVIESVCKAHPELRYDGEDQFVGMTIYDICNPQIITVDFQGQPFRKLLSEDWSFCKHVTDLGIDIYCDTSILLNHLGGDVDHLLFAMREKEPEPSGRMDKLPLLTPEDLARCGVTSMDDLQLIDTRDKT